MSFDSLTSGVLKKTELYNTPGAGGVTSSPKVLGVMTAAHVQDFVKTLALGHGCPLFSPAFLSSRLARPLHNHPDQNTTTDFHCASETFSLLAAPTRDSLEATPTRRDVLFPAIASLTAVRLEPTVDPCTASDGFCH